MPPLHVVICAFGPARTTEESVVRAIASVGDPSAITVVAGTRLATRRLQRLGRLGVTVADGVGSRALTGVLDGLATTPTLLVHDDVRVPPATADRLAGAWEQGSGPVTARSDDPGTDHEIDRPGADVARAAYVRPVCLLGLGRELSELAPEHLVSPRATLHRPDAPLRVVAGTHVRHERTCTRQLAPPQGPDGRPLLVATLIVRDEATMIGDCLRSLEGLVDRVEICDTGSTDPTREIARNAGANVIERAWRDDFAWARNEVIEQALDAWYVLWIDADERVECDDPVLLRRRLATGVDAQEGFLIPVRGVADDRSSGIGSLGKRLFSPARMRFDGALHEQPRATAGGGVRWTQLDGLSLIHLGYRPDIFIRRNKGERNLSIARRAYGTDPSPQNALNYARSLSAIGSEPDLQERLYREVLAASADMPVAGRAAVRASLAELALDGGRAEEALEHAAAAMELVPHDDRAAAVHARAAFALDRPELVVRNAATRRSANSVQPAFVGPRFAAEARVREAAALSETGDLAGALHEVEEVLSNLPVDFNAWPDLLRVVLASWPQDPVSALLPIVLRDLHGGSLRTIASSLPADGTARLCAEYCEQGGALADAVQTGLVAAIVAGRLDVADRLARFGERLPAEVVERLAVVAAEKGMPTVADRLRGWEPAIAGLRSA